MIFGVVFTLSFTNYTIIDSLWVGLFSFLEADTLYNPGDRRAQQEGHRDPLQGRRQCGRGLYRRHGRDAARNARGARPAG